MRHRPSITRRRPWRRRAGLLAGLALSVAPALAQDRADLERARIVGSRELPKVTYIVPWRKPAAEAAGLRPPTSVLDEALAPVDPEVHRRQVGGHARWLQTASAASPAAPSPAAPSSVPPAAPSSTPSSTPSRNPDPPQEKRP